jgi:diketogulonate reductase-like aldo/keto reductase
MIASIRPLKSLVLFCLLLWYCSVTFVVVKCQTNLFRGYKTGKNNDIDGIINDVPLTTTLSNGVIMPLVGMGVGNLQRNLVETMIHHGLKDDRRIRLIDTAHASGNEREVARGITTGIKDLKEQLTIKSNSNNKNKDKDHSNQIDRKQRIQVHVVTKIWYTYLGYERTKLAIDEILQSFEEVIKDPSVDLKVTLLLHWPQCFDEILWMNCEEEEQQLPDRIKNAGPPPHLDRGNAWKGSWRALEDVYESQDSVVASIGISNFDFRTLQQLLKTSRIAPHLAQINVWSLMNETPLIELMNANNIHLQVYNVMNGIIGQVYENPKAHHHILMVANQLKQKSIDSSSSAKAGKQDGAVLEKVFFAQAILKWLVQFGISVIPRTSNPEHLAENSAVSLSKIPVMSQDQIEIAGKSMAAIINNEDLKNDVLVQVRFHAKQSDMFLYWVPEEGDTETQLAFIEKGSSYDQSTYPGHTFKAYHAYDPDQSETFSIRGHYGESQDIHVEL